MLQDLSESLHCMFMHERFFMVKKKHFYSQIRHISPDFFYISGQGGLGRGRFDLVMDYLQKKYFSSKDAYFLSWYWARY